MLLAIFGGGILLFFPLCICSFKSAGVRPAEDEELELEGMGEGYDNREVKENLEQK